MKAQAAVTMMFLAVGRCAAADAVDGKAKLLAMESVTSLDGPAAAPWHLKLSFQMNDLKGKLADQGTVEMWWTKGHERTVITSPKYDVASGAKDDADAQNREHYLIKELVQQVIHPVTDYSHFSDVQVRMATRDFGKVKLSCVTVFTTTNSQASPMNSPQFCSEPDNDLLRVHQDAGQFGVVRNHIAKFRGKEVAIDNTLSYAGQVAISAHVDALEEFAGDPSDAANEKAPSPTIPGVILAGHIKRRTQPIYPESAKRSHISGSVVLYCSIGKDGTIRSLHVIASPDPSLTDAAKAAVKQWTYEPYLLDGQPTEVDTTITANFNLSL